MTLSHNSILRSSILAAGTVVTAAGLIVACSSSSTTTETSSSSSSTKSSSSSTGSTKTSSTSNSSGSTAASSSTGSTAVSSSTGSSTTLYERLGGHAGIRSAVNAVVTAELANADIASYFFFQAGAPTNGHPSAAQIEECFTDFVASAAGGPETYPATLAADAGGPYTCRDLKTAHRALQINPGVFTKFLTIAAGVLMPTADSGVSGADLTTLAGALEGEAFDDAGGIVVTVFNDAGLVPFPGNADAASKLDATY